MKGSEVTRCKPNQASIYENSCKVCVAKGKLAQTLYDYGPEFYVEFKVRILAHPNATWTNILHVTNGPNSGAHGNRFPA